MSQFYEEFESPDVPAKAVHTSNRHPDPRADADPEAVRRDLPIFNLEIKINEEHFVSDVVDVAVQRYITNIGKNLEKKVAEAFQTKMVAVMNTLFLEKVEPMIASMIKEGVPKYDTYGNKIGEHPPLHQMMEENFKAWLQTPVDAKGEDVSRRLGSATPQPLIMYMTRKMVQEFGILPLKAEVEKCVSEVTDAAREQIQAFVMKFMTEQMMPNLTVPQIPVG